MAVGYVSRGMIALLLVLFLAPDETFAVADGKAASLRCRIKRVTAVAKEVPGAIVEIEVKNGAATAAEPLAFEFKLPKVKDPIVVRRVEWPWHGRGGRGVAAGAKRVYPLLVPRRRADLRGARVRVVEASFFRGTIREKPAITVLRLAHETASEASGTVHKTTATVRNDLVVPVDAVFRATCSQPVDARTLVRARVLPGEQAIEFAENEKRVEGTFVARGNDVSVQEGGERARQALVELFTFVSQRPLPPETETYLVHGDWIGFDGDGFDGYGRLAVRNGRLVGAESSPGSGRWRWTPEPAGGGYVIAAKELEHAGSRRIHRYRYRRIAGLFVPVSVLETWDFIGTDNRSVRRLDLFEVRATEEKPARPPTGAGVNALRKAWNEGYRHPSPRPAREVRVTVDATPAHAEWQGVRKPTADVLLRGDEITATAVGEELSPTARDVIGAVIAGRLAMWRGVDFAGRGAFDRVFDGARIAATENGRVAIENAPYRFVEIADGRVQALGLPDGRTRRLHWRKVGGVFVVDRIAQGHEQFRVRYRRIAGVLAPVRIEIRNRFGPDWGVETLELADR